jgi:nucleotide-binding universal stress UspA family protein
MATLWEASHLDHDMPLVVKIPRIAEAEDPAAIVSFEMEQMILPRLSGAHVPRFAGAAGFDRLPYIAMERIPGPSLLALSEQAPRPFEEVAETGAAVADALAALHRQNLVHLDVKPANILRRPTGEAVLVDFGLAHHALLPDLMEEEFRLPYGTAPFMAPEQVMGLRSDPRSDLFALGAMLYLLVTGEWPHGNPLVPSALRRRLWRDPHPPRALRPDCPDWLQEIVLRCLEADPERRHPTAAHLAFDLRHPDQVPLTARAARLRRDNWLKAMRRRLDSSQRPALRKASAAKLLAGAPIVMVAVDLVSDAALHAALRETVGRILSTRPGARLACVNVLRQGLLAPDSRVDEDGESAHVRRLVELQHWAAPLGLDAPRVTFHVLEAADPAQAILEHARVNGVDHVVLGARTKAPLRNMLGSVSAEVVADAPCSVTVVRSRARA